MIALRKDAEVVMAAAELSMEIIVGMYVDRPAVYVGLAPKTILSDDAYIWLLVTEVGEAHSRLIARYSKKFIETVLLKYPMLHGHCFTPEAARWLTWLGAKFVGTYEFEIRRVG
jgi:hypothetical protein